MSPSSGEPPDRIADVRQFFVSDRGVDGQAHDRRREVVRYRARSVPGRILIDRLPVDRDWVVDGGPDPLVGKSAHERVSRERVAGREPHHVLVVDVPDARCNVGSDEPRTREVAVEVAGVMDPALVEPSSRSSCTRPMAAPMFVIR